MSAFSLVEVSASSVPTPPAGEDYFFMDLADSKFKRKDSAGVVHTVEVGTSSVLSVFGRTGAVVSANGDYIAAQVTNTPAGNIIATDVQSAINELDAEKAPITHVGSGGVSQHAIVTGVDAGFMSPSDKTKLDGVAVGATANQTDAYLLSRANHTGTQTSSTISDFNTAADARISLQKAAANGLATLDATLHIPISQIPASIVGGLIYQGTWDASSNSPTLSSSVGTKGYFYKVNVAGSTNLDGITDWKVGDVAAFNGSTWDKFDSTDQVASVFGRQGAVVATAGDYIAAQVTNTPAGSISATTVQAALNQLDTNKVPSSHVGSGGSQHAQVTSLVDGFMIAADKSKLDGISPGATAGITALTGEVTASGPGSAAATLSNAAVIAKVLTGFSVEWGMVTAADSILIALQKLAGRSAMTTNIVSKDVTVPSSWTWIRSTRTQFTGTTKVTVNLGGRIDFIN